MDTDYEPDQNSGTFYRLDFHRRAAAVGPTAVDHLSSTNAHAESIVAYVPVPEPGHELGRLSGNADSDETGAALM